MASQLIPCKTHKYPSFLQPLLHSGRVNRATFNFRFRVRASDGGDSYLDIWKKAVDRERKSVEFQKIVAAPATSEGERTVVDLEAKSGEFQKLLEVPREERDRIQRLQVIDRAAAAIAAARSVIKEKESPASGRDEAVRLSKWDLQDQANEQPSGIVFLPASEANSTGVPGPDFWSWTPPSANDETSLGSDIQSVSKPSAYPTPTIPVIEKERSADILSIPFESKFRESFRSPLLPPFQSLTETEKLETFPSSKEDQEISALSSLNATEAVDALGKAEELPSSGMTPDGSRWWTETGIERRPYGVICRWTLKRGVSADQVTEWQEKFWEASDELGYKELGSEKSGRDSHGNVWREFWRESMWQDSGLAHLEKTADKWGKNVKGEEWQEKWWEQYNAAGGAEKWAHKWCSIDPNTPLDAGHAHIWHERWGEKYDGHGGSTKYTDKWAERCEDGGRWWSKWGDKWDENFDPNGHGIKQGETWWQGGGESRWNRTWGEHHNGTGWIHKYGKSSSGEHWDTHVQQDTWYERFPHFGFYHCYDNSVQLREVPKPSEILGD